MENFKANGNKTILKNESCDIFPSEVFMEKESLIKKKWKKTGFCNSQYNTIDSNEKKIN